MWKLCGVLLLALCMLKQVEGEVYSCFGSSSRDIKSPNYPNNYPNNASCTSKLTADQGYKVYLTRIHFTLEEPSASNQCNDYVKVYNNEVELIGTYCGDDFPPSITSSGRYMTVVFYSNGNITSSGFQFLAEAVSVGCGFSRLTTSSGLIASPNYPSSYTNNAQCTWKLGALPTSKVIRLTFEEMSLQEESTNGCQDYVEVFYGETRSIGRFCGSEIPPLLISSRDSIKLQFISDSSVTNKGFVVRYEMIERPYTCPAILDLVPDSNGKIQSPNYPNNYPSNVWCSWSVSAPVGRFVCVKSFNMSLQSSDSCYDYVELFDGGTKSLGQFCDNSVVPSFVKSSGRLMTVVFSSDSSISDSGFTLEYEICGAVAAQLTFGLLLGNTALLITLIY